MYFETFHKELLCILMMFSLLKDFAMLKMLCPSDNHLHFSSVFISLH